MKPCRRPCNIKAIEILKRDDCQRVYVDATTLVEGGDEVVPVYSDWLINCIREYDHSHVAVLYSDHESNEYMIQLFRSRRYDTEPIVFEKPRFAEICDNLEAKGNLVLNKADWDLAC